MQKVGLLLICRPQNYAGTKYGHAYPLTPQRGEPLPRNTKCTSNNGNLFFATRLRQEQLYTLAQNS
jgi:hypothetical protein